MSNCNLDLHELVCALRALTEEVICTQRPSTILRPKIGVDGSQWCVLYGKNLMEGIAGFGDTPELAMLDFDNQYRTAKAPRTTP